MKTYLIILIILILSGCAKSYVEINGEKIIVEIPSTIEEKSTGLMYRESLCDDCGMLFIFTNADFHNFWMKNTLIPLDIIYINADLTVVDIMHAEPCYADNCTIYTPKKVALFVLETNVNKFDESIIGKKIRISTK